MLLRPAFVFIPPALPSRAERPPIGSDWIHEIKHDGYRMMMHRDAPGGAHAAIRKMPLV